MARRTALRWLGRWCIVLVLLALVSRAGAMRPSTSYQSYFPFISSAVSSTVGFGLNFVTSAQALADEDRFTHASSTGATIDRWPFYWRAIETAPGVFDWSAHDVAVSGDVAHGFSTDAVLMTPPGFYLIDPCGLKGGRTIRLGRPLPADLAASQAGQDCTTPRDLDQPVFSDGTDWPGPGKTANPNNPWARFVFETVQRYKPGGVLAQQQGWPAGAGVRYWEMWNEPDYEYFWNGNVTQYARLLKVGYLATYQADPTAEILFGGLSNVPALPDWPSGRPTWLNDTLNLIAADPDPALRDASHWYFTIHARHNYSWAWATSSFVSGDIQVLAAHGLSKPVWVNESGVPACDDYPGPACDTNPAYYATLEEQAAFDIQNGAYALSAGATAVFHFQLYDDCSHDAWGIYRNPVSAVCSNQSPNPDTPRPVYDAYRVLSANFVGVEPLWQMRPGGVNGTQEWLAFYRPATRQRVLALWARFYEPETAQVPATGDSALRLDQTGAAVTIWPVNGNYTLELPAATNRLTPTNDGSAPIGGKPYILIETDTHPPTVTVSSLPPVSPPQIALAWLGYDLGSGIAQYQVWVQVDGGPLTLWLETPAISAVYIGSSGHRYGFAVRPLDRAGNWAPVPTEPQVTTTVQ